VLLYVALRGAITDGLAIETDADQRASFRDLLFVLPGPSLAPPPDFA